MTSGLNLPLIAVLVLSGLLVWAILRPVQPPERRRRTDSHDPLQELMRRDNLGPAIDLALHRNTQREASQAVLIGRIDQFAADQPGWGREARQRIVEQVAAALRVSLRRDDRVAMVAGSADGDGFSILVPGADERAAVRIADRLRSKVRHLRLPRFGGGERLTASFGVAAGSLTERSERIEARARRALEVAVETGPDKVVPASAIGEHAPVTSAGGDVGRAASAA